MIDWKRWFTVIVFIGLAAVFVPVQFNADVFNLLPTNAPTVQGLQRYQQSFGSSEAVILALQAESAEKLENALPEIARHLQQAGLARQVVWQSPFAENTQAQAELLAYLWLNQPPEKISELVQRLSVDNASAHLHSVLEKMALSFNAGEVAQLANDPWQLSVVAQQLGDSNTNNPFASPDGLFRIMYLAYPKAQSHYWAYKQWLEEIDHSLAQLRQTGVIGSDISVSKTGNPVFVAEFGNQLMRDLGFAALGTLLVVLLLFWWAHRQWSALWWLAACLGITLVISIFIGSALFTRLNAVSLGFAALLMGLAVDYGLIVFQARRSHPELSVRAIQKDIAPSILWAAVTTAGAFLMLTRSSLPGLMQLGALVAIGIIVAAIVVLYLFLPSIRVPDRLETARQTAPAVSTRKALVISSAALVLAVPVILLQPPAIETDVEKLQFSENQAQAVHDKIQRELERQNAELWLIFTGKTVADIEKAMATTQGVLEKDFGHVPLVNTIPLALWPKSQYQQLNLARLQAIAQTAKPLNSLTRQAGFTDGSMLLANNIFAAWESFGTQITLPQSVVWPQHVSSQWLFSQFSSMHNKNWYALGKIGVAVELEHQFLLGMAEAVNEIPGAQLVGWSLLADELASTMQHDFIEVLVPLLLVLLVLLAAAFRHGVDILLSFLCLGFSLLLLCACMAILGWKWNIMNLTALPLLLGAGVDYSIHIQLALKRYQAQPAQVFNSVGKAILLCGASTTVAFTSLGMASNAGIASLGKVAGLGISITALTAVFLLPGWWLALRGKDFQRADNERV